MNTRCFVIMPFGDKVDVDGRAIDFDAIYADLIEAAVSGDAMRDAGGPPIDCLRCDRIEQAGWVHRKMITHIHDSEVVVVDLSTLNPNVFYELGVRHALRDSVTVLTCRKGTKRPFNLQGFSCIDYDLDDGADMARARRAIASYVVNGLKTTQTDSLVREVLQQRGPKRLEPGKPLHYRLRGAAGRRIGIVTGDLRQVKGIDAWVNSENTDMQMARFFDGSGSAVIRFLGARRNAANRVVEDTIADALAAALDGATSVPAGTVIATPPGALAASHGVKRVFHVAAVQGELGAGYRPVADTGACVTNALQAADADPLAAELHTMLLPLMGTGTGRADLAQAIQPLIDAALRYLQADPPGVITTAYFLAFNELQLQTCERVLAQCDVERQ